MLKLLTFLILISHSCCLQKSLLNDMAPNEYLVYRTHNKHYLNFKRDQSQFNNDLCKDQLDAFVKGLATQDAWALKSEIKLKFFIVTVY